MNAIVLLLEVFHKQPTFLLFIAVKIILQHFKRNDIPFYIVYMYVYSNCSFELALQRP